MPSRKESDGNSVTQYTRIPIKTAALRATTKDFFSERKTYKLSIYVPNIDRTAFAVLNVDDI